MWLTKVGYTLYIFCGGVLNFARVASGFSPELLSGCSATACPCLRLSSPCSEPSTLAVSLQLLLSNRPRPVRPIVLSSVPTLAVLSNYPLPRSSRTFPPNRPRSVCLTILFSVPTCQSTPTASLSVHLSILSFAVLPRPLSAPPQLFFSPSKKIHLPLNFLEKYLVYIINRFIFASKENGISPP